MTDMTAVTARVNAAINRYLGEQPRYAYFESADGWMFCWTTERMYAPGDVEHNKFQSFVYMPKGKGARTGDASRWVLRSVGTHSTRKAAKARALRLYRARKAVIG